MPEVGANRLGEREHPRYEAERNRAAHRHREILAGAQRLLGMLLGQGRSQDGPV